MTTRDAGFIEVVEWPVGIPDTETIDLEVSESKLKAVWAGHKTIPLSDALKQPEIDFAEFGILPWVP